MLLHIGRRRGFGGEGGLKRLRRTLGDDNGILSGLMFTTVRRCRLVVCGGIEGGIDRVANDEIETVLEAEWRGTRSPRWILWNLTFRDRVTALRRDRDHQADDIVSARWSPSWAHLGCRLSPRRPHRRRRPA